MPCNWALTGREQEMRLIEAALCDPGTSGVVVGGGAGVGKSRLVKEATKAAAVHGFVTQWITGSTAARSIPFGALSDWATELFDESVPLVQLVRGLIDSLTSGAPDTSLIVAVDDAHLLDDMSIFVVQQLIARRAAKVVLVIRDGDPVPEAARDLWKENRFERLVLQPLARQEVAELMESALGGLVDAEDVARLWRLTRGNALYVRTFVEQELAAGRLALRTGRWRWLDEPVVPADLADLIESRMGALGPAVSEVVDLLAVAEPLPLEMLIRIAESRAVEEADDRGLITAHRTDTDMSVRLSHPLYGEVRRRRASPIRLRRLRGLVVEQLANAPDADDLRAVVRRATLWIDSDLPPDAGLLVRAARGALSMADMPLADQLAAAAVQAGATGEAHLLRSFALSWMSRPQQAEEVVASMPANALGAEVQPMLLAHRVVNILWGLRDPQRAKRLLDEAASATGPGGSVWVDALRAMYWATIGRPDEVEDTAARLDLSEIPSDIGGLTAWALAVAAGDRGRTTEALGAAGTGYAIVRRDLAAPQVRFAIADRHVGVLLQAGLLDNARSVAAELQRDAADLPGGAQAMAAAVSARVALAAGRLEEAQVLLKPAIDRTISAGDTNGFLYRYQLTLTLATAQRGEAHAAAAEFRRLDQNRHPGWGFIDYELAIARAWVASLQGVVSEAVDTVLSAAETARARGRFAVEVMCLQAAVQFGDGRCASRLRELADVVEGPRVGLVARFAEALHAGDGDGLHAVSVDLESMGDVVAALDCSAHASLAYRRANLRGSALKSATRAQFLAECCAANTPALRQVVAPLPLTDREREIVMLLGSGASNRDIAARLTLSIRTVESHVYRAMAKTGTTTREDLAALLSRGQH
ncbi:helix-turn-helix transcriptional regulator [Mycobacterium deserti]|uniref:LuxR C-terminal-related transcriptional regulator n=1 Tax=Mycobacterium deserti TaxID=2978347 RepID=A0ABT2MDJ1_9MYCO|nr:LuxR family transcriptional regulator [Mycobacterium deserti]MCT7660327.1 LuxR C-terminal-related transcriptional regulator [Mycobacterium deserti]